MPPRSSMSMTDQGERKRKRTESNRAAARRCRARKEDRLHGLLAYSARLEADNAGLKALIREYKDKLAELHSENDALLLAHKLQEELVLNDDGGLLHDLMKVDDDVTAENEIAAPDPPLFFAMDAALDPPLFLTDADLLFLSMDADYADPMFPTMDADADTLDAYCQQLMLEDDDMPWSCYTPPPPPPAM